jgi:hypothetical protein
MQRFRIKQSDLITINVTKENKLLYPSFTGIGFSNIEQIKNFAIYNLSWEYKGKGRRIEIAIHNLESKESKYLNTFS